VPFLLKPREPDRDLEAKLMREAGGILKWMIDGCLDWQKNGLGQAREREGRQTESYFFRPRPARAVDRRLLRCPPWKSRHLGTGLRICSIAGPNTPIRPVNIRETKKSFGMSMQRRGFEADRRNGERVFSRHSIETEALWFQQCGETSPHDAWTRFGRIFPVNPSYVRGARMRGHWKSASRMRHASRPTPARPAGSMTSPTLVAS